MRHLTRTVIQRRGYRVFEARSGVEGLSIWAEHAPEISLVLTDMVMPGGLDGIGLAREIRRRFPGLPILLTTGYSDAADQAIAEGLTPLAKPYAVDALAARLDAAARQPNRQSA